MIGAADSVQPFRRFRAAGFASGSRRAIAAIAVRNPALIASAIVRLLLPSAVSLTAEVLSFAPVTSRAPAAARCPAYVPAASAELLACPSVIPDLLVVGEFFR
jgi:hypothetical protein